MDVKDAIQSRRAYRALEPAAITDDMLHELADAARLMCSCFNNQPWRFVFARSEESLEKVYESLTTTNEWARNGSLIIAVFTRTDLDCIRDDREYALFDLGMAAGALILRATEMDLVAHPIAGFDPAMAKQALGIPDDYMLITLLIVGKRSNDTSALTDKQAETERKRPERLPLESIFSIDSFDHRLNSSK